MKKFFFFMLYRTDDPTENNSKLIQQMETIHAMGYETWYLCYDIDFIYLCRLHDEQHRVPVLKSIGGRSNALRRRRLYLAVPHLLRKIKHFDYVYIRSMIGLPSYVRAINLLKKHSRHVIMEIPTYPPQKAQNADKRWWRRPFYIISNFFERLASRYVQLYTLVGAHADKFCGRPAINIENGINCARYTVREQTADENCIHILLLAHMMFYHGYDRMIRGLKEYYAGIAPGIDVKLHFVGTDGDGSLKNWEKLSKKLELTEHIRVEGAKYGAELNKFINGMDIGVASLRSYELLGSFGSELKLRDYMVRGVPFIYSSGDDGFQRIGFGINVPRTIRRSTSAA